jgi:peptidoglycan/xylan/chitin deacetylase (PgdA/CDA1 family)
MRGPRTFTSALLWLLLASSAQAAPACFAPTDLAATPGEERPVKGNHRFDAPEPPRTLAPFQPVADGLRGAIRRVDLPKGKKLIALTFDLCEQPGEVAGYDGAIFDYLRAQGIKATLFTGGKWMRSHSTRFPQLMTDPLFEIANHASAHRNLRLLAGPTLEAEIAGPQRAYEAIRAETASNQCFATGARPLPARLALFRFPYGACNDASLKAVNDAGLLAIQWDVSTGDPSPGTSAQAIADAMVRGVRPGSIVISHANGRGFHTAAGLPLAIPKLKAAGYQFVTVSELLAAGRPVIAQTCYDSHPGDTDRYDHPLGLLAGKPGSLKAAALGRSSGPAEQLPWLTSTQPTPVKRPAPRARPVQPPTERLPWQ